MELKDEYILKEFSANNFCNDINRRRIEQKYSSYLEITNDFNRQAVSYQLNKSEYIHSWLKYKEGFSSYLVEYFLKQMNLKDNAVILDPFLGSGTTSIVCQLNGISSVGFDILPISKVSMDVKSNIDKIDVKELTQLMNIVNTISVPINYTEKLPDVNITKGAYPLENDYFISYVTNEVKKSNLNELTKTVFKLCVLNILEESSYTVKGGQYLGWDYRAPKIILANENRVKNGKKPLKPKKARPVITNAREALFNEINKVYNDVTIIQKSLKTFEKTPITSYFQKSSLFELPKLKAESIDGVITSPPYCNRYDYTRTYALELAYLEVNDEELKKLRQELLSCTVESKSKDEEIKNLYISLNRKNDYDKVHEIIEQNKVLNEILDALEKRKNNGDLNNAGIIKMVKGYFIELSFIFYELYRISKKGAKIVFVNDNVRYGGEVIPVDFISSNIAENIGFKINKIYTIKQQKGNSSQQMAKFGKVALRKSITIWEK